MMKRSLRRYARPLFYASHDSSSLLYLVLADVWYDLQPLQQSILSIDEYEFLIAPLIFTLLSFFTRMFRIGLSPIVTWDEAQ